ncbi:f-boxlrr-repeat protein [Nicotiana attenuata]|uniref:F-boxlrr-repeat protein n=1 Tax=Nicotiana attenuata TaxID=49451 RepID=A0A314L2R4_NICAT|nr:f-boxlrr-repeat protein [Nicotiana attenuata]
MTSGESSRDDEFRSSNLTITPPSKKQKETEVEETLDRLSELPESLLVQILSLLPTKDAFATCIDSSILDEHLSQISRCLSFAVEKKVENVVFWSDDDSTCTWPESFGTCSSLINLDFIFCCFSRDAVIAWKSLKSLKLEFFLLSEDHIVNLLSGCPSLETLELSLVAGFSRLEINSFKLKTLNLKGYWIANDRSDHSLEIIAPYLQHLEISGDLYDLKCRLVDVSSLLNACLTFNLKCIKDIKFELLEHFNIEEDSCRDYHQLLRTLVQDNLQKVSCATELTIGTWFTEVLCMFQFKGLLIPVSKCKHLTLELHMKKFNLYGVVGFLRASPFVETLNIDMDTTDSDESLCKYELKYLARGDNIDLQSWISSFVFPNLKKVKIVISSGVCLKNHFNWGFDKLFKLSEFLLKRATVLEKFVLMSKRRKCKRCSIG